MMMWLILTPVNASTVLIASAGAPVGVGGVDLARAVSGDRRHGVPRNRQPPGGAAPDPPQHHRVRAAAGVAGVGPGLLGADRPLIGAEDQHGVGRGQHVAPGAQRRAGRARQIALLDLRADDEQHEREQQPGHHRDGDVLEASAGHRPSAARDRARAAAESPSRPCRKRAAQRPPRRAAGRATREGGRGRWCRGAHPSLSWTLPHRCRRGRDGRRAAPAWEGSRTFRALHIVIDMPGRRTIGVDMGGTKVLAGAVDEGLGVHHRAQRTVTGLDQSALLDITVEAVQEAREAGGAEIAAVGFGIPCLMDQRTGRGVIAVNLPLADIPFGDIMAERLGLPVFVDNDGNVAALAEHRAGAARGTNEAVILTIGTGIGGGLDPARAAVPRIDRVRGRTRAHGHRHGRAALPGELPQPRLRRGAGLRHRAGSRGRAAGPGAPRFRSRRGRTRTDNRCWGRWSPSSPTTATRRRSRRSA